jgi:hypothetical protein
VTADQLARNARKHLDEGDKSYEKAAKEMLQLRQRHGWTNMQIAEAVHRPSTTVQRYIDAAIRARTEPTETFRVNSPEENVRIKTSHARSTLRDSTPKEIAEELLSDPKVLANVTKAQNRVYEQRAIELARAKEDREIDRKGGEAAHHEYTRRQRVSEIVNVTRGAASGLRFVAGQAKDLDLASDESIASELVALMDEIDGFTDMLRSFLNGEQVSDAEIARLLA